MYITPSRLIIAKRATPNEALDTTPSVDIQLSDCHSFR